LARKALDIGGSMPAVMNAANNIAVEAFLNNKIKFTDILKIVEKTMNKHEPIKRITLKKILDINEIALKDAYNIVNK
jgi:1-deoxy-D-xylulose-5-phosphate reductoisomerase